MPTPPGNNIPAIGTIANPAKTQIALFQGNQLVRVPLSAVANVVLDAALGDGLLLSGDAQETGFDRLALEGDESGDLLLS